MPGKEFSMCPFEKWFWTIDGTEPSIFKNQLWKVRMIGSVFMAGIWIYAMFARVFMELERNQQV